MQVRAARTADASRLAELSTQLGYPASPDDMQRRLPHLDAERHFLRVAERETGDVVGWIHASHVLLLDSEPYVEIKALVVDEGARGQRIGEALLESAEEWARSLPCLIMRVRSNVLRERAHRFYERRGYAIFKTQRVFGKTLERVLR